MEILITVMTGPLMMMMSMGNDDGDDVIIKSFRVKSPQPPPPPPNTNNFFTSHQVALCSSKKHALNFHIISTIIIKLLSTLWDRP